ncbi:cobyrinate a,c-diamide synthase [Trichothermofontia sichuanensis B231]|uniref:cobyrinate a,c-diamide synthase n=1 Tax=Trichothermofontia sichuanensis TaxID=3045816 RepID=UPI0022468EDC|nr:cobyrinate a,c-diamide synthase [Trichothermofontia sichuanensis]UZQ54999.1 cobyrinate a,c-diamide synthase [Trichothermofontia sichuanensis B231]
MSLVIAGERSGVGKTTVTLALLAALRRRGLQVQSFKVGPDYIDPMFHQAVTGRPCRNLDPILTSPRYVQTCFHTHTQTADYALIEGVMGLFDGVEIPGRCQKSKVKSQKSKSSAMAAAYASTAHIAQLLNLPVLLVLDCRHLSGSIAAIVDGYQQFDPDVQIAGVVLNRVGSDRHRQLLTQALDYLQARQGNAPPVLGVIHRQAELTIPDRHLGLVPTAELDDLPRFFDRLADLAEQCFDWDVLLPLFKVNTDGSEGGFDNPGVDTPSLMVQPAPTLADGSFFYPGVRLVAIAVAYDRAFSFYYADNLDLLRQLGADLCFWSPLQDATLPANIQGLYFGGGFPEMFAPALEHNQAVRRAVQAAIRAGMPTYAECGGLMYLAERLIDFEQRAWEMVGVLPCTVAMGDRLVLGYRQATALHPTTLIATGETVWGHEFHRSAIIQEESMGARAANTGAQPLPIAYPLWQTQSLNPDAKPQREGWYGDRLLATYLHLHWGQYPHLAQRFVQQCAAY